ncbi:hypothetical protein [Bosea sp. (in: a-proteobacteria)]|uniref:hypothetical protein n=1 Tax=Bosea sp. (in: a-proteobacteria) TaxID=1871050 RepID=UPI002B48321C|nr:hypothetical protein [Bosea sp. (in: a-proteobacteria)]WRH60824.1 MAG: hypothetical protein RSE11_01345 [Bosea sp. (in: a-proteobacteria)]
MAPSFRVTVLAGRELHVEFEARNEQAADDIARFLFAERRELFRYGPEEIVDVTIEGTSEGAAS